MADPRFHKRSGSYSLEELAKLTGCELATESDASLSIEDVAPLDTADNTALSFLDNIRYKDQLKSTKAGACIIMPDYADIAPSGTALLLSANPYKSYALAAQSFYPADIPQANIHENSAVASSAKIGQGCHIEAGAVIGENCEIGNNCWIEANAVIASGVVIGNGTRIGANASITHSIIGDHVHIYPGCCIGQDGFGFAIDPAGHVKVPQLGRVIIEDSVNIGANTTIDRGAGPDTVIGQGSWIDNLVQIGHNVKIGKGCVIVSQVGISGSTIIGDFAVFGGQAGVTGHLNIGSGARIGAQAGVMRDIEPGQEVMGAPAVPSKQFMRQVALLHRMVKKGLKS